MRSENYTLVKGWGGKEGGPTMRLVDDNNLICNVDTERFASRFLQEEVVWK